MKMVPGFGKPVQPFSKRALGAAHPLPSRPFSSAWGLRDPGCLASLSSGVLGKDETRRCDKHTPLWSSLSETSVAGGEPETGVGSMNQRRNGVSQRGPLGRDGGSFGF